MKIKVKRVVKGGVGKAPPLKENKTQEQILAEGLWKVLKGFSRKASAFSLEKGGSVWGQSEKLQQAKDKYQTILDDETNKLIKNMMDTIEKEAPGFPNNDKPEVFASALTDFYILYDSLKAAAAKFKPGMTEEEAATSGAISPVEANALVMNLRRVVKKLMDYDLGDRYKATLEEEQKLAEEEEIERLEELFGLRGRGAARKFAALDKKFAEEEAAEKAAAGGEEPAEPEASTEEPAGEPKEKDILDPETASATWEGLKSMRLPKFLGLLGGSMAGLGWLANTDWFGGIIESMFKENGYKFITAPESKDAIEWFTEKIGEDIKPGEGILKFIERLSGIDLTGVGATKDDLANAMKTVGITPEDLSEVGIQGKPKFKAAWDASVGQADATEKLGNIFKMNYTDVDAPMDVGDFTGQGDSPLGFSLGKVPRLVMYGLKTIAKTQGRSAIHTGFTGTAASMGLAKLGAASTAAGIIGIGLVAAGASIAALRKKATSEWGSRARLLQDLWDELIPFPVPEELVPLAPTPEEEEAEPPPVEPEEGEFTPATDPERKAAIQMTKDFKTGDYVWYTEANPKSGKRDTSMGVITAMPGEKGVEMDEEGKLAQTGGAIPALDDYLDPDSWRKGTSQEGGEDREFTGVVAWGRWNSGAKPEKMVDQNLVQKDKHGRNISGTGTTQGSTKKVWFQLQTVAARAKSKSYAKMIRQPINASPVGRDEGNGFRPYIQKATPEEVKRFLVDNPGWVRLPDEKLSPAAKIQPDLFDAISMVADMTGQKGGEAKLSHSPRTRRQAPSFSPAQPASKGGQMTEEQIKNLTEEEYLSQFTILYEDCNFGEEIIKENKTYDRWSALAGTQRKNSE